MPNSPAEQLSGRFLLVMSGFALSTAGTGLVLPFTAIYISDRLGLGIAVTAAYFACTGGVALAIGLLGGRLVDQTGARAIGALGALTMAVGYLLLGWSHSTASVLASAIVVGAGNGLFQPAFTPIVAGLVSPGLRRRAFAVRHLIMNAGLGVGALVGSVFAGHRDVLSLLFLGNGLSYLPLALVLWMYGRAAVPADREAGDALASAYRRLLSHRPVVLLVLTQFFVAALGFAQLTSSVPLLVQQRMGSSSQLVGAIFVANTVAVIILQYPLARLFERITESATLVCTALLWILAFSSGSAAALASGRPRTILLFVFPVVFAAGEAAHSSSFYSLLARVSPKQGFGRANALVSLAYNFGNMSGPALGIVLIGGFEAPGAWLALTVPLALPLTTALLLCRATPPAQPADAAPREAHVDPVPTEEG